MKKLFFVLLILFFASSASATVYRWVDERGVVNFADDYSKVPPRFQNKVEEMSTPKSSSATSGKTVVGARSGEPATQPPPIAQTLVREGDFAIKLAETLRIGRPASEAEAESMLASAGIAPKNGWIADYPMTPDIIGELENAVGEAADAKKLSMPKNEALKALRTTAVEFELPIVAEVQEGYTETPPPATPEYTEPSVVDNYYYAEGPPVITYYPPPWDYYYLYGWVPFPFWYAGFYFPGYFILNDFHRVCDGHGYYGHGYNGHGHNGHGGSYVVTNHIKDSRTGRYYTIDPARRHAGMNSGSTTSSSVRGFNSTEPRNGARSIFERSRERTGSNPASKPMTDRGRNNRSPANLRSGRGNEKQVYNTQPNASGFNNRNSNSSRPPVNDQRMSRTPLTGRTFSRPESMNRQNGSNVPRPSAGGGTRSFSSSSWGSGRSFSPTPQGGSQHFGSSLGSRGFSGVHQEANRGSGFGQGGGRGYGSSLGSRGFSGSPQGGAHGGSFGHGGARF